MKFYGKVGGKHVPLGVSGPDTPESRAAALVVHQHLIEEAVRKGAADAVAALTGLPPARASPTVAVATAAFLADAKLRLSAGKIVPGTLVNYRTAATQFTAAFGPRSADSLRAVEIEAWAAGPHTRRGKPVTWSSSYQHTALATVQAVLDHAGVSAVDHRGQPVRIDRPPKESRGSEVVLTDTQFALVLADVNRFRSRHPCDLAELLTVLRETGARPQEIAPLTAQEVDWEHACRVLKQHKTKRKTGKDRPLPFCDAVMAILKTQRDRYGSGVLFRTRAGKPYSNGAIIRRLVKTSKRVGFRVTAYGLGRHSYCTEALVLGIPEPVVAALVGHTSTAMVNKHYGHVGSQAKVLREAAEKISRAG